MSDVLAKIERANAMIRALCEGEREWIMRIPAQPDYDPDLVIGAALHAAEVEIARLTRELEAARERERTLRDALERLRDEQNGPPLLKRERQWADAMAAADNALAATPPQETREPQEVERG